MTFLITLYVGGGSPRRHYCYWVLRERRAILLPLSYSCDHSWGNFHQFARVKRDWKLRHRSWTIACYYCHVPQDLQQQLKLNWIACLLKFRDWASASLSEIKVSLVKAVVKFVRMYPLMEATILALVIVFMLIRTLRRNSCRFTSVSFFFLLMIIRLDANGNVCNVS